MPRRKDRILVLLDTSVLVRAWTNRSGHSASARVLHLWLARRIQLAVSAEVIAEYVAVLEELGYSSDKVHGFIERLEKHGMGTQVSLGRRIRLERDRLDEPILSTADAGHVEYLITLDRDMLEMPIEEKRRLKFRIVTPTQFLAELK